MLLALNLSVAPSLYAEPLGQQFQTLVYSHIYLIGSGYKSSNLPLLFFFLSSSSSRSPGPPVSLTILLLALTSTVIAEGPWGMCPISTGTYNWISRYLDLKVHVSGRVVCSYRGPMRPDSIWLNCLDKHYAWLQRYHINNIGSFEIGYAHDNKDWRLRFDNSDGLPLEDMFGWAVCQHGCMCAGWRLPPKRDVGIEGAEEKREIDGAGK